MYLSCKKRIDKMMKVLTMMKKRLKNKTVTATKTNATIHSRSKSKSTQTAQTKTSLRKPLPSTQSKNNSRKTKAIKMRNKVTLARCPFKTAFSKTSSPSVITIMMKKTMTSMSLMAEAKAVKVVTTAETTANVPMITSTRRRRRTVIALLTRDSLTSSNSPEQRDSSRVRRGLSRIRNNIEYKIFIINDD